MHSSVLYFEHTLSFTTAIVQVLVLSCTAHVPGHENILKGTVGDTEFPINCYFSQFSAPIWSINSTLYEPLSLKLPLNLTSSGISLTILTKNYNNTSFQCFSSNGTGLFVHKDTITLLSVQERGKSPTLPECVLVHYHSRCWYSVDRW